jgi:hypothetical protein
VSRGDGPEPWLSSRLVSIFSLTKKFFSAVEPETTLWFPEFACGVTHLLGRPPYLLNLALALLCKGISESRSFYPWYSA